MKITVCFFLAIGLLIACNNKVGDIKYKVKYTTEDISIKLAVNEPDSLYSQFGDYITSLTPSHFSSKINIMCYQDNWDVLSNSTHVISYVDGHDNDPRFEIATYADFSNNQEVEITPILYSTDLIDNVFKQSEVTFSYFNFVPYYFYQEVDIPIEYENVVIDQFNMVYDVRYYNDSVKFGSTLKIKSAPFIYAIFSEIGRTPFGFVFGNTDSTYLFNKEGANINPSADFPFGGSTNSSVIRSNKYSPLTVSMPEKGETIEMYSTISFDTENLIQVYAGNDNIAFTSDDIFIYAPNYWERLKVKLEIK